MTPWRIPWLLRVVVHPDIELDLLDTEGRPDHAKIMGWTAVLMDLLLIFTDALPPLGHFIVLNSVIFGWIGMRTFLASKTVTSNEQINTVLEVDGRNPGDERFVD